MSAFVHVDVQQHVHGAPSDTVRSVAADRLQVLGHLLVVKLVLRMFSRICMFVVPLHHAVQPHEHLDGQQQEQVQEQHPAEQLRPVRLLQQAVMSLFRAL